MCRTFLASSVLFLSLALNAQAQVKLQPKYIEGTKSTIDVETETHQILTIAGMDLETSATNFMVLSVEIGKRMQDGTLKIQQKVTQLQTELSLPGGIKLAFDSGTPDKKAEIPQLEVLMDFYRATLNNTTTTILDKNNKIQSVMVNKDVVEKLDEQFKDQFDSEKLKMAAVQEQNIYPREAVKVGDTWKRTEVLNLSAGQKMTFENQYEFVGTVQKQGRTLDRILRTTLSVSLEQDPNAPGPAKITNSNVKSDATKTELLFDRKLGATVFTNGLLHITGDLTLSVNSMDLPGKIDLTIKVKTTVKF